MTLLSTAVELSERRAAARGPLAALADSLAADLDPVLARELFVPDEKARLTRRGGRCEADGLLLEFDPFSPRRHQCPACGREYTGDEHYRWWIMGYQLWLAERAVHAALLFRVRGEQRHGAFAVAVLDAYADRYLGYPNRDNVLGPTRPFFSTYLESIWLLQLAIALDVLESSAEGRRELGTLGGRVRERLLAPSAELIAGFGEGMSNRQVWNNAALLAARSLLGCADVEPLLFGESGVSAHLTRGLLADGTWYEGENYHLFAHRGLWYGVRMAETMGATLDAGLVDRFEEAFATPFLTALPDFTFPSRRDSQYKVSLRQWRFAELAELGLARRRDDRRLRSALATLYDGTAPRRDTGRWRSTAEAERNAPAAWLDRASLGWRSLLAAPPELPTLEPSVPRSVLLDAQGYAVLRRDAGSVYVALDFGHSGAGHGHPDRLNLTLVHGATRWLEDVGTGSYVDPSLHWYRSTLAHNAPLVNGHSQRRVHGALLAFEDRGAAGWVRAEAAGTAPGVRLERSVVLMPDYLVDELAWRSDRDVLVDLPIHADGDVHGAGEWRATALTGGAEPEDGFAHLFDVEAADGRGEGTLRARIGDARADAFVTVDGDHEWWRAVAPGPPGELPRRFHCIRARGRRGAITAVWSWRGAVARSTRFDDVVTVEMSDGSRHEHRGDRDGWHIALAAAGARSSIDLAGVRARLEETERVAPPPRPQRLYVVPRVGSAVGVRTSDFAAPLVFTLGAGHYRRSEPTWGEAGSPTAIVTLAATDAALLVSISVTKDEPSFAPAGASNALDNEHPDTNSDGVQLYLVVPPREDVIPTRDHAWLLVPEPGGDRVRVTERRSAGPPVDVVASWRRTADGYAIDCAIPISTLGEDPSEPFLFDVIVNEISPDRERRRGQLVLGGAAGEFVYLRGDRQPAERHVALVLADV